MTFKALVPGLYVYHCATPMVGEHIANGMYGMILVEPENGLTPGDREFFITHFTSSFHAVGEVFDEAYGSGSLETPPQRGIQSFTVPPGGAAIAEFKTEAPGNYSVVDHALARVERGLAGALVVTGAPNPDFYDAKPAGGGKE